MRLTESVELRRDQILHDFLRAIFPAEVFVDLKRDLPCELTPTCDQIIAGISAIFTKCILLTPPTVLYAVCEAGVLRPRQLLSCDAVEFYCDCYVAVDDVSLCHRTTELEELGSCIENLKDVCVITESWISVKREVVNELPAAKEIPGSTT